MSNTKPLKTPAPPYYAVIFTSKRSNGDNGYSDTAAKMLELAATQVGFLGVESFKNDDGLSCTISYWETEEALRSWKQVPSHKVAQDTGKSTWYEAYSVRVCKVERAYEF